MSSTYTLILTDPGDPSVGIPSSYEEVTISFKHSDGGCKQTLACIKDSFAEIFDCKAQWQDEWEKEQEAINTYYEMLAESGREDL